MMMCSIHSIPRSDTKNGLALVRADWITSSNSNSNWFIFWFMLKPNLLVVEKTISSEMDFSSI